MRARNFDDTVLVLSSGTGWPSANYFVSLSSCFIVSKRNIFFNWTFSPDFSEDRVNFFFLVAETALCFGSSVGFGMRRSLIVLVVVHRSLIILISNTWTGFKGDTLYHLHKFHYCTSKMAYYNASCNICHNHNHHRIKLKYIETLPNQFVLSTATVASESFAAFLISLVWSWSGTDMFRMRMQHCFTKSLVWQLPAGRGAQYSTNPIPTAHHHQ